MSKILLVSGIQIYPAESGGQLRSANLCEALEKLGHQVEIYSFTGRKASYFKLAPSQENQVRENITEYVNHFPLWGVIQFLFYKLKLPPFWLTWLTKFYLPLILRQKIKATHSIIIDFPFLYPLTKTGRPVHINAHNAEYELYPDSPLMAALVKKLELKAFLLAESILFCSLEDKLKFCAQELGIANKSFVLPNGINITDYAFNDEQRKKIRQLLFIRNDQFVFLFTGSKFQPNKEALQLLRAFAERYAPDLTLHKIVIMVVGSVEETPYQSPCLKIIGKVPSMLPYFWASDFGLNAIKRGSGTNVKMMEFIAARLPILTSLYGSRGLKLVDHESCLIFDESNLLDVLIKATGLTEQQKQDISTKAFANNLELIDMHFALKSLSIKW